MTVGKLYNLARMTTATTGTGTITLGSAVSGYLSFSGAGVSNADVVSYGIIDGSNSECGTGTYTSSGTTLTRTVTKSTNSNSAISLSGNAQVFITPRAEDLNDAGLFTTGTLDAARLPNPAASSLGGVNSKASVASNFLTQIGTDGSVSQAQPAFSDISGTATAAQLPTGSVLQCLQNTYATNADLTTSISVSDTIPTSTSGTQILSQAITPGTNTHKVLCRGVIYLCADNTGALEYAAALFRGSTCIYATGNRAGGTSRVFQISFEYLDSPASTSAQTYTVRVGNNAGSTWRANGTLAARQYGGVSACTLTVMEISA